MNVCAAWLLLLSLCWLWGASHSSWNPPQAACTPSTQQFTASLHKWFMVLIILNRPWALLNFSILNLTLISVQELCGAAWDRKCLVTRTHRKTSADALSRPAAGETVLFYSWISFSEFELLKHWRFFEIENDIDIILIINIAVLCHGPLYLYNDIVSRKLWCLTVRENIFLPARLVTAQ